MESAPPEPSVPEASPRGARVLRGLVLATAALACLARLVGLEESPPGFYLDEAVGGTHIVCMLREGTNFHGTRWPLFSPAIPGGFTTPVYLYSGVAWTWLFGPSIGSLRALSAFSWVLMVLGLFVWIRRSVDADAAAWVALAAAVSPWGFTLSRVAYDPPLALSLLVWGVVSLLAFRGAASAVVSGVLLALAAYTYPPMRAVIPLLGLLVVLLGAPWRVSASPRLPGCSVRRLAIAAGTLAVVALPVAWFTLFGELQTRYATEIGIFSDDPDNPTAGRPPAARLLQLAGNWLAHFSPSFLLHGDGNLRQATSRYGLLGWLDLAALSAALALLLAGRRGAGKTPTPRGVPRLLILAAGGVAIGVLPAALTFEAVPHAQRSLAAIPFLAVLSGLALYLGVRRWPAAGGLALGVAWAFVVAFGWYYARWYPREAARHFHSKVKREAVRAVQEGDWEQFAVRAPAPPPIARRYYDMVYGGLPCRPGGDRPVAGPDPGSP